MPDEEEAFFYFTLNDFENLVMRYGADKVLKALRNDPFMKLTEWFINVNHHDEAVLPALLKRKPENA